MTESINDLKLTDDIEWEGGPTLRVLDRSGDSRFGWDPTNEGEVGAAREHFAKLRGQGHLAYRVDASGGRGETIHEFDPMARETIMVPPTQGG